MKLPHIVCSYRTYNWRFYVIKGVAESVCFGRDVCYFFAIGPLRFGLILR